MKKVLVVLASYNGEKYIKEQLNSIVRQKKVDKSIVIFDDNSSDRTIEISSNFLINQKEIDFKIIKRNKRTGSAANNFMMALSELLAGKILNIKNFDYVALSDQDDVWEPDKLNYAVEKLEKGYDLFFSDLKILKNGLKTKQTILKCNYEFKKYDYLFEGGSAGCTYVFNKSILNVLVKNFDKLEISDTTVFSHDWFIYFIVRVNKFRIFKSKISHIFYRIHSSNQYGSNKILKISLALKGWYFKQSKIFIQVLNKDTIEFYILNKYQKNWFSRIYILIKYNFNLMRSPKRFLLMTIISLMPKKLN